MLGGERIWRGLERKKEFKEYVLYNHSIKMTKASTILHISGRVLTFAPASRRILAQPT